MMHASQAQVELAAGALNGESPRWRHDGHLLWVDTRAPSLHLYDPVSKQDEAWEMPSWIGCCVATDEGALVALRTGLFLFRFDDGSLTPMSRVPYDCRRFIFNDGGCDPRGRFLVGDMYLPLKPGDEKYAPDAKPLFRFHPSSPDRGVWREIGGPAKTSNGLAWSPDGRSMYQSDTACQTIYVYDYDLDSGTASNRRVFATVEVSQSDHGPDGAAVDRDGFYLSAIYGEGCLLRFDPNGRVERRIDLPVQYPTMPAYGGNGLETVYVTSANWPIEPQARLSRPMEGSLLSFAAPVPGLASTAFDPTTP